MEGACWQPKKGNEVKNLIKKKKLSIELHPGTEVLYRVYGNKNGDTHMKPLRKRRWKLLQVESSIACNLQCIMCPWKQMRKDMKGHGLLSEKIWNGIRPYLPEFRSVDFTGGGEPLLQPRLLAWIKEAKSAGCEVGFLTNGLLLGKDLAHKIIIAELDWICFSIDGSTPDIYRKIRQGSDFDRVCNNLMNITKLRRNRIPKTPKIMINFVLMTVSFHQVEEIVRLAAHLGVDQVNFKQCDVIRGKQGKDLGLFAAKESKEIRRLSKNLSKARRLARKLKVLTTFFPFTPEELPVCEQDPRNFIFVRHDGAVTSCINLAIGGPTTFFGKESAMPTVHYGFLPDSDLEDLWQSDVCLYYRDRFQHRVQAYEKTIINSLIGSSGSNRQKILRAARDAMPEAPEGCKVCHYLYNV